MAGGPGRAAGEAALTRSLGPGQATGEHAGVERELFDSRGQRMPGNRGMSWEKTVCSSMRASGAPMQ